MTKQQYLNKRQQLLAEAQKALDEGNMELYNSKYKEVQDLDANFENTAKAQANLNALNGAPVDANAPPMEGKMNDDGAGFESVADMYNSVEYRTAFMDYVVSSTPIPEKFKNEAGQTKKGEVAAVIPVVYIKKIYEKLDNYGKFLKRVTQTNYPPGVSIPIADLNPTAEWVAERGTTEDQKATSTASVIFTGYKLRCTIAVSFETSVMTLGEFENVYINAIVKAMGKKLEDSIFNGRGTAYYEPEGILNVEVDEDKVVTIAAGEGITYQDLVAMEGALEEEYEDDAIWIMPKKTFYNNILGMVDEVGHPIARVDSGISGKPEHTILGRTVEFCKYMKKFTEDTDAGTTIAAIYRFEDYAINMNKAMTIKKYTDENTDDEKTKGIALADGKPIDTSSLVVMKIATA